MLSRKTRRDHLRELCELLRMISTHSTMFAITIFLTRIQGDGCTSKELTPQCFQVLSRLRRCMITIKSCIV